MKKLSHVLWKTPFEFAIFLDRCIKNYGNTKRFQDIFKDGMNIIQPEVKSELSFWLFAMLLVNLSNQQPLEERIETIARLEQLTQGYPHNEEIVLEYARGLFNLSCDQPLEERIETIAKLEQLTQIYLHNEEFVLTYAKGLFNLSIDLSEEAAGKIQIQLAELFEKHPHVEFLFLSLFS